MIARSIAMFTVWTLTLIGATTDARAQAQAQAAPRSLLSEPARLKVEQVKLAAALEQLAKSAGVPLAYSPSLLASERAVSCDCSTISVGDALAILLANSSFDYRELDEQVVLTPKQPPRFA